jgi:hypothetical protein
MALWKSMRPLFLLISGLGLGMVPAKTLLILPVQGDMDKSADIATVNDLYREAIQNGYKGQVKTPQDSAHDSAHKCADRDCAAKMAVAAGADEVIFSTVKRLGSKWIFSSTVLDADGGNAFNQRGTAQGLEDLEPVTRRVSDAILARQSVDKVATVDNITGKEEDSEPTRRRSLFTSGFSLGYLYPTNDHSYSYLKYNSATGKLVNRQRYSQLVRLGWLNSWEFRENMMLSFDGQWAVPYVIGGDINLLFLFSKSDFSPFLGGGLGITYVGTTDDSASDSKRNSGPAVNIQGGMIFFRTYDIHLVTRAEYQVVFNSDTDRGMAFDVGVVFRPREKGERRSFWSSAWVYILLGGIFLSVAGVSTH